MSRPARRKHKPSGRTLIRTAMRGPLAWLRAYPLRGQWHQQSALGGTAEALPHLDGHAMSRATRAARTLARDAPKGLQQELGLTPSRWLDLVMQRLQHLKLGVHAAAPVLSARAERQASRLEEHGPRALRQTARLARWVYGWHPDQADLAFRRLRALAEHWPTALLSDETEDAGPWGLRVLQVAVEDGPRPGRRLLRALTGPGGPPLRPPQPPAGAEKLKARRSLPPGPKAKLRGEVLDGLEQALSDGDPKRRRLGVALVDGLRPRAIAEIWSHWYAVYDALASSLRREREGEAITTLRAKVIAHREKLPPIAAWSLMRRIVRQALALPTSSLALLVDGIEGWPELVHNMAPRVGMAMLAVNALTDQPQQGRQQVRALIRASRRLLSLASASDAIAPWEAMLIGPNAPTGRTYRAVDTRITSEAPKAAHTFYAAVGQWYEQHPARAAKAFRDQHLSRVTFALARLEPRPDWVVERGSALLAHLTPAQLGHYNLDGVLHYAHSLTRDGDTSVALVKSLLEHEVADDLDEDETPLAPLADLPESSRDLLARLVLRGDPRAALRLAGRCSALAMLGAGPIELEVPRLGRARPWMRSYPLAFRAALRRLQSVDPTPAKTAEQILGRTFPRPERLDDEIAALRRKIEAASNPDRLRVRLARQLERRRALEEGSHTIDGMSEAKLVRLMGKLDHAADRHTLAAWEVGLGVQLDDALGQRLRLSSVPSWLSSPPMSDLWPHLMQLDDGDRRVALRLLTVRSGPYPWDLRDAPQNRRFVAQLERRGINTTPWVDGIGVRRHTHDRGEVFLQLERDPVEIFRMGHYFGTCLSPGDVNFFSTVANAADLNKRVLFARFEDGQVVGRCLLAVTREGHVLTFHPYCHHHDVDFRAMVVAFTAELIEAMGTTLTHQGQVPQLVAKDWYDDGPVDLTGRFAKLQRGGELEQQLRLVAPMKMVGLVQGTLGEGFLDARSFPSLMHLTMGLGRDDLAAPLLHLAHPIDGLDRFTRETLLSFAWDAGAHVDARRYYERVVRPGLQRRRTPTLTTTPRVLAEMGEASFALQLLRRSRPRGVEHDEDERDADRLVAAAWAHRELKRTQRAQRLLTRAIEAFPRDNRRETWQQALAAL